jgi:flagellar basal-body rod protein FlgB
MSWIDPVTDQIESYLKLDSLRENLVVSNLANVDTPHYKTVDVNFEQALQQASMGDAMAAEDPQVHQVRNLVERPDGNNVSLDRETMLLAQTQLQYRAGVELLKADFQVLQMAIDEKAV